MTKGSMQTRVDRLEDAVGNRAGTVGIEAVQQASLVGLLLAWEAVLRTILYGKQGRARDAVDRLRRYCDGENVAVLSQATYEALMDRWEQGTNRRGPAEDWDSMPDASTFPPMEDWTFDSAADHLPAGARPEWYQRERERNRALIALWGIDIAEDKL